MIHLNLNLSPNQKKIIKGIGYPAFFSLCFSVFLALTFPAERFLPIAEAQLTDILGRKVTIEDLSISPFGSVSLEGVSIEVPVEEKKKGAVEEDEEDEDEDENEDEGEDEDEEAENDEKKAASKPIVPKYYIEEMNLDVGIFSLLFGDLDLNVTLDFLGGQVEVAYKGPLSSPKEKDKDSGLTEEEAQMTPAERAKQRRERRAAQAEEDAADEAADEDTGEELSFSMVATGLNLIQFWDLKDFLPLPMFGQLDFGIELSTKTGKFKDAEGKMWVDGKNISLGKGQSKVEVIEGMGPMTVDSIGIKSLLLEMLVKEGKCSFKTAEIKSDDIAATAEGDIQFADPMSRSRLNLYFTFQLLEGYADKSDKAKTLVSLMPSALSRAKRTDGSFGYAYRGMLKTAQFRPSKVFSSSERASRRASLRRGNRPSSTVRARNVQRAKRTPTTRPAVTPPEREPEPEPEPDFELGGAGGNMRPSIGAASSDELQARQNDSQSRRMEATIHAMKEREAQEAAAEEEEEGEVEGVEESEEEGGSDEATAEDDISVEESEEE